MKRTVKQLSFSGTHRIDNNDITVFATWKQKKEKKKKIQQQNVTLPSNELTTSAILI